MRRFCVALLVLVLTALLCLGAAESIRNRSGKVASGVTITFSEEVRITSYDESVFPSQVPSDRALAFTFSGGLLADGGRFAVAWTPSDATVESYEWAVGTEAVVVPEPTTETTEYVLAGDSAATGVLQGKVTRTMQRGLLPFAVTYAAAIEGLPAGATLSWDTDIYVDADGEGNTENDAEVSGATLEIVYTENYNPTVKLIAKGPGGAELGTWRNMVRNDFVAGTTVALDGEALLRLAGVSASTVTWRQLHMEQNSFEYMTEYAAVPQSEASLLTACRPQFAGRYVYALADGAGRSIDPSLAAWVVETPGTQKRVGVLMADIWNDSFGTDGKRVEGGGVFFTDEDVREKLTYLSDEGFETVGVHAGIVNDRVLPTPRLTSEAPNLLSDEDLRNVFEQIGSPHLSVQSFVSGLADPELGAGTAWSQFDRLTRDYYEAYFGQYKARLLELAELAKETGTASITIGQNHPYLWGLGGIWNLRQSTARWVAQEWVSILKEAKQAFSGDVGLGYALPETPVSAAIRGVPDFVEFTMGGFCDRGNCDFQRRISATRTAEELRAALVFFAQGVVDLFFRELSAPLMMAFVARSYDGAAREYVRTGHEQSAYDSWKPEFARGGYGDEILDGDAMAPFQPSFRDQTLLLETYFPVLARMEAVESIFCQGEYWKMMSFAGFAPLHDMEIHQANNGSLQGKPGLLVAKLWASILDPNERNLYRRVRPLAKAGSPVTAAGNGEDAPRIATGLIDDFRDGDLLSEHYAVWSSSSFDGGQPRTPLETECDDSGCYLLLTKAGESGMTSTGQYYVTPVSGVGFDGLYLRMASSAPLAVNVELMSEDSQCEGGLKFTWVGQSAYVDTTTREFRMPLGDFLAAQEECPGTSLQLDAAFIRGLGIYILPGSSGDLRIYEVGFYGEGDTSGAEVVDMARLAEMPSSVLQPAIEPDWSLVPDAYVFAEGRPIAVTKLYMNIGRVPVSRGTHWGLPGSDLRSLKLYYSGGLFVRIETWTPSIPGAYQYEVHLWPPSAPYGPVSITINPSQRDVWAGMGYEGQWVNLAEQIQLVSQGESYIVAFMPEFTLPSGQSSAQLQYWSPVLAAVYYDDGEREFYQVTP